MKKLYLLLTLLFTAVSGVWADSHSFTVTYAHGSAYGVYYQSNGTADSSGSLWDVKWVSGNTNTSPHLPSVTISSDQASISGYNGYFQNGNYTISVPEGFIITGYSMQAKAYEEGATGTEKVITPSGENSVTLNTSSDSEISVTNLSSNVVSFSITGTEGASSRVIFSSFTITVEGESLTALSSANSDKLYYFVCQRGFLTTNTVNEPLSNLGSVLKNSSYVPTPLRIVTESGSTYLKTFDGKYITSNGTISDTPSGTLSADDSGNTDFPFVLKIGNNYINSTTGGTYGLVFNDWGDTSSEYDAGNRFAIIEAPSDETLHYSLSDTNGAVYTGDYSGIYGVTIPFTGCVGYSLTNTSWDSATKTLTATINFPFAVSSNDIYNWTYINSFENKSGYSLSAGHSYYWHVVDGSKVIVHDNDVPDNTQSAGVYTENEKYKWAIIPSISGTAISFTIKNSSTGTFITNSATNASQHTAGTITLTSVGTPLTYQKSSTANCGTIYKWCIPSVGNWLSVNSINGGTAQELGVHNTDHDGLSIGFYPPADFATLEANLMAAWSAYYTYRSARTFGTGLGQYNDSLLSDMDAAYKEVTTSPEFTAAQLSSLTSTLSNPSTKLTLNMPVSNSFIRVKSARYSDATYLISSNSSVSTYSDRCAYIQTQTPGKETILYFVNNSILGYSNAFWMNQHSSNYGIQFGWDTAPNANPTTFTIMAAGDGDIGQYNIRNSTNRYLYTDQASSGGVTYYTSNAGGTYNADNNGYNFIIEEVTSLPVTISSAKYATLYSPVALTIPSGVRAFYMSSIDGEEATLKEITTTIPAETPVVLYAENISEATTFDFVITTAETFAGTNLLAGNVATKAKSEGDLVLGVSNGVVGFYPYSGANLSGFKAYMPAANVPSEAKELRLVWDETTGIKVVSQADYIQHDNTAVFNLNGQRVNTPQRGIYIVNGKKVVVK